MMKNKLKELMKQYCFVDCELENVIKFVNDLLYERRCELERNEPYATNTIQRMQHAEEEVWDLLDYVEEIMQEDN